MAKNPDPNLKLTSTKGTTRTLDDWSTMFHLCLVILPPRPEASVFIPIAERIFKVFGDADCRTAFCVVGNDYIARGVLGAAEDEHAHRFVAIDLLAKLLQPVVHRHGHRVARTGAIEHQPGDAIFHIEQDLGLAHWEVRTTPSAWSC